ncbi:hypothetical protein AAFC00_000481 [Neodothiora populina]|uniref:Purine-cytosine permease n=1 Tax=Neodothiora populina TaxID=2781224 RepID=A0ABR3PD31_9PEZI
MNSTRSTDPEKGAPSPGLQADASSIGEMPSPSDGVWPKFRNYAKTFERTLIKYNFEARGIQRVLPSERHSMGFMQIGLLWFSINLAANNITLGMLGPAVYGLSFLDSAMCAVFGMLVGVVPVAYIATFGPLSGHRAMVIARYAMGWYPAKLVVILNIIVMLGYCLIDAVVAGQILSAVSPNDSLSVIVGVVITAVITLLITVFGYSVFHWYERYSWLPQLIVFSILAGVAGPHFDLETPTQGDRLTRIGNRLSFFSICLSAAITYSGSAADFFVYYPENTPRWKTFSITIIGLSLSFTYAFIVGIGLGSGLATQAAWSSAYETSQGALITAGFAPLGTFGSFCSVIVALGLIANMTAPTYVSGVDFQVLGSWCAAVPRFVWNTVGVIIYTVCAIAGRASLAEIFTNFLALMGYWVTIWIAITLEEQYIFKRLAGVGFDWEFWNQKDKLPIGIAALIAFLVGWAGAIISMAQVWYVGPLAASLGEYGGDMGNYVGFAWAALVYPPLRWLELKKFGR